MGRGPFYTAMQCPIHKVDTFLQCGKCDTPVCAECVVIGPAGTRCRSCASHRSSPMYQVSADRLGLGLAVGMAAGSALGYLLAAASGAGFGFFTLWIGLLGGGMVGEAILRTIHRKRGPRVEIVAGISAVGGALIGLLLWLSAHGIDLDPGVVTGFLARSIWLVAAVGTATFAAVSRIRFL